VKYLCRLEIIFTRKKRLFTKFENEIAVLTEMGSTMGIEEFLLDRAEKKALKKADSKNAKNLCGKLRLK